MKVIVIGAGYVGLTTGVCLAERGNEVVCIDNDIEKIKRLNSGDPLIYEEGLEDLLQKNLKTKKIKFISCIDVMPEDVRVIYICVGTPEKIDGDIELKYVYGVIEDLITKINKECIIVIKSTVPVGECEKIESFIQKKIEKNVHIEVVSNPEFLSQGRALRDSLETQRIIIGAESKQSIKIMNEIYKNFRQDKLITTRKNAEMIKYASNSFLALKISYINSIANLCEKVSADVQVVAKGMGMDERIGSKFLKAGIGYGGSCFPKDTKALVKMAEKNNIRLDLVRDTILINESQNLKLIGMSKKYFQSFKGLNIAVLGLTFKPNTNDLRGAPSLKNIELLLKEGANITIYDPIVKANEVNFMKNVSFENTIESTIKDKDVCFIFTEWESIKKFKVDKYYKLMKRAIIFDGRNCYELPKMKENKIEYFSIGR